MDGHLKNQIKLLDRIEVLQATIDAQAAEIVRLEEMIRLIEEQREGEMEYYRKADTWKEQAETALLALRNPNCCSCGFDHKGNVENRCARCILLQVKYPLRQ